MRGRHEAIQGLPDGDVPINAGDGSRRGSFDALAELFAWFAAQPHRAKLLVAGNHDFAFERETDAIAALTSDGGTDPCDARAVIDGIRF
jgi:hypothetical protein